MSRRVLALAAAVAAFAVAPTAATAAPPDVVRFEESGSVVLRRACAFPLRLFFEAQLSIRSFYDAAGELVRIHFHASDVVTATNLTTGESMSGHEVLNAHVDFVRGSEMKVGVPFLINRPGGVVAIEAGRVLFTADGEVILNGNFTFSEEGFGELCEALS